MSTYIQSYDLITPIGATVEENVAKLISNTSGVTTKVDYGRGYAYPIGLIDGLNDQGKTRFENLVFKLLDRFFADKEGVLSKESTLVVLCTTKGNIECLDQSSKHYSLEKALLGHTASCIKEEYNIKNNPLVLSNACISGVAGLVWAHRYLEMGYEDVVVVGADVISEFVVSGFHSFMALSEENCKPYDKHRTGLNIGEAAAVVHLSTKESDNKIIAGATSDDANHISGPSRTGEGLQVGVKSVLKESGISSDKIDFISAHGTATPYNDEMECKGLNALGMQTIPLNSFKGYTGHTLGAAGLMESIFTLESMKRNLLFKNLGYHEHGVTQDLEVIKENYESEINIALKIASGFGGGNAAVLFKKN